MSKPSIVIGRAIHWFPVAYPLASILYVIWLFSGSHGHYWDGFPVLNIIFLVLLALGSIVFLVSLFKSTLQARWRVGASLFALPMLCCSLTIGWSSVGVTTIDRQSFDGHRYLLVNSEPVYSVRVNWFLYECGRFALRCKLVWSGAGPYGIYVGPETAFLTVDREAGELHAVIDNNLYYTVGSPSHDYHNQLDRVQRGDYTYVLARYEDEQRGLVTYALNQCEADYHCTPLPAMYSITTERERDIFRMTLWLDEETDEIRLTRRFESDENELIFSYGQQATCYTSACFIPDMAGGDLD
jgi:hypothetical protein